MKRKTLTVHQRAMRLLHDVNTTCNYRLQVIFMKRHIRAAVRAALRKRRGTELEALWWKYHPHPDKATT